MLNQQYTMDFCDDHTGVALSLISASHDFACSALTACEYGRRC
jgi:hypothetical protein